MSLEDIRNSNLIMDSKNESTRYRVIMLPWLAHGHISPFLELAKRLTIRNFHIYLCSTPIILQHIEKNLANKYHEHIQLVELNLPSSDDLPPHYHTTNGLPPHLMGTLKDAYDKCSPDFSVILEKLSPHLLIYDYNQWWAADAASSLNIPCAQFFCMSGVSCSVFHHCIYEPLTQQYPFREINLGVDDVRKIQGEFGISSLEDLKALHSFYKSKDKACIILIKSITELDGKYVEHYSQSIDKKVLSVGPLIQESSEEYSHEEHIDIFRWLDKKTNSSVVFVSFGSEYFLSEKEIEDIAYGLELSNVCFIWVIRFPKGNETSAEQVLPRGFLERIGERGMVIEKWAPQAKILSHSSIGGFISHCGWGSVLESIRYGVPIIAIPMQLDQPYNAKFVVAIGVGIIVGRDADGRLKREEIAKVVRQVVEEKSDGGMRKKVVELGESVKKKGDEDVDKVVIESLVELCEQKNM